MIPFVIWFCISSFLGAIAVRSSIEDDSLETNLSHKVAKISEFPILCYGAIFNPDIPFCIVGGGENPQLGDRKDWYGTSEWRELQQGPPGAKDDSTLQCEIAGVYLGVSERTILSASFVPYDFTHWCIEMGHKMRQDSVLVRTAGTAEKPGTLKLYKTFDKDSDTYGGLLFAMHPSACDRLDPQITDATKVASATYMSMKGQNRFYANPNSKHSPIFQRTYDWSFTAEDHCPKEFTSQKIIDMKEKIKLGCAHIPTWTWLPQGEVEDAIRKCKEIEYWTTAEN